jgi:hypothetical protein
MMTYQVMGSGRLLAASLVMVLLLGMAGCAGGTPTSPPEDPSAWYVSPQGSDTQNTCHSSQSPCLTINAVLAQASPGAVIYIAPGTYNEYLHLFDLPVDLEGSGPETILNGGITRPVNGGVINAVCSAPDPTGCVTPLTVANLSIRNGFAESGGGGVYVRFTPLVMKNVNISGNTANSGGGLYIDTSNAMLDNVTISHNTAKISDDPSLEFDAGDGGGIFNNGQLYMSNSTISENIAGEGSGFGSDGGGIYNRATAKLTNVDILWNSVPNGSGGGINNVGSSTGSANLVLVNDTLGNNHATHGGGLSNDGAQANITGTTINNNNSAIAGGGILNTNSGTVSLINSTISGNIGGNEGGGIASNQGSTLNMTNATLAANQATHTGGLVYESGPIYLVNVLLDGNSGGNCGSVPLGGSYNISSDASCSFIGEFNNNGVTPRIGPLQDNGGPTLTHALLTGSPAIDAGTSWLAPNIDQRGLTRPRDGNNDGVAGYDIGAVEYGIMPASGEAVSVLVTATPGPGDFTFQETGPCFTGPGPEYGLLAQGTPGEIAPADGRTEDGTWFRVQLKPGVLCWVSGSLGTFDGNPFGLPVPPVVPTPTATRIPIPGKPGVPISTSTMTQAPAGSCSSYTNKTDCESHGCTWPPPGIVPLPCH